MLGEVSVSAFVMGALRIRFYVWVEGEELPRLASEGGANRLQS
jgi:hypothetical protein